MAFLTKIKKGIKHPLLRKIVIVLVLVTLSYLIFRRYKLKEGMDSRPIEEIIADYVSPSNGKVIEINDFINSQKTRKKGKRTKKLTAWRNKFTTQNSNSGIFVIPPILQMIEGMSTLKFVNPLDNDPGGRDLIVESGGIILNKDNVCPMEKMLFYKGLKRADGKRADICNGDQFIVFTGSSNSNFKIDYNSPFSLNKNIVTKSSGNINRPTNKNPKNKSNSNGITNMIMDPKILLDSEVKDLSMIPN